MAVSCQTVINIMEKFSAKKLAEDWDNVGLQIGNPAQKVASIFLSLDLNEEILEEALAAGAEMLIVHHTPFFKSLKNLRTDLPGGRLVHKLVQHNLALYAAHTNLDAAWGGVNDVLAAKIGLEKVELLTENREEKLYKLAVFVPHEYTEKVREEICRAGAGWLGNYADCTFSTAGTGTFLPLEGTNPFMGQAGKIEKVAETRLETIVPVTILSRVINALLKAHPYEEVAYDVYPLANPGKKTGIGRIGYLPQPLTLHSFIELVKERLAVDTVRYCGLPEKTVQKVALCGGSGAGFIAQAAFRGAHVYLTADLKYHEAQEALGQGLALVDAGHFGTEHPVIAVLAEYLQRELAREQVNVTFSQINSDPFRFT